MKIVMVFVEINESEDNIRERLIKIRDKKEIEYRFNGFIMD